MTKTILTESDMEMFLLLSGHDVTDGSGDFDSTKVVDVAIDLGFESYMLDGEGSLQQTLIFIKQGDVSNEK